MSKLLHADLTYRLRGIGFQIHNELGGGHAEIDYETAMIYALEQEGILYRQQPVYRIQYRDQQIGEYRPDLMLAGDKVMLDFKATPTITVLHKAQGLSYLAVTEAELGIIMNFGGSSLQVERLPNFLENRRRTPHNVSAPTDVLYPEITHAVLKALFQVHAAVGPGFLHQIYRRATRIELPHHGLNSTYLKELPLRFRGTVISMKPTRLFIVEQKLLVATVALQQTTDVQTEKLRWAMRETGCRLGLIANFYPTQLDVHFERLK